MTHWTIKTDFPPFSAIVLPLSRAGWFRTVASGVGAHIYSARCTGDTITFKVRSGDIAALTAEADKRTLAAARRRAGREV